MFIAKTFKSPELSCSFNEISAACKGVNDNPVKAVAVVRRPPNLL